MSITSKLLFYIGICIPTLLIMVAINTITYNLINHSKFDNIDKTNIWVVGLICTIIVGALIIGVATNQLFF